MTIENNVLKINNVWADTRYYSQRTKTHYVSINKRQTIKDKIFAGVVCVIAVSPIIGTLIVLINELS